MHVSVCVCASRDREGQRERTIELKFDFSSGSLPVLLATIHSSCFRTYFSYPHIDAPLTRINVVL